MFSVKDWLALIPPTALLAGAGYTLYLAYCPAARKPPNARCNNKIRMSEAKVVDMVDVEDIAEKAAFCRCWKTKNVSDWLLYSFYLRLLRNGRYLALDLESVARSSDKVVDYERP